MKPEYVEPNSGMKNFFAHRQVTHRRIRGGTAQFSIHGWSSRKVPVDVESAARMDWDGLLVDPLHFMGYQRKRKPKPPIIHRLPRSGWAFWQRIIGP